MNAVLRRWLLYAAVAVVMVLMLIGYYPEVFGLPDAEGARPFPGMMEPSK